MEVGSVPFRASQLAHARAATHHAEPPNGPPGSAQGGPLVAPATAADGSSGTSQSNREGPSFSSTSEDLYDLLTLVNNDDTTAGRPAGSKGPENLFARAQADLLADPSLREKDPIEPEDERSTGATAAFADLSPSEQQTVHELRARDQEVRRHEAAHQSAGGGLAGGATYSFQTGPDGKRYAVGGEVKIKTGGGDTPAQRLAQAAQVRAAALAPANPSGADLSVAAAAAADSVAARAQLVEEQSARAEQPDDFAAHAAAYDFSDLGRSKTELSEVA